jgi:hypothetical protein
MPLSRWYDAFHSACFVISTFPTLVLHNLNPYQKLFYKVPVTFYKSLIVLIFLILDLITQISYNFDMQNLFSLVIVLVTKATSVYIYQVEFTSNEMLFSMNNNFIYWVVLWVKSSRNRVKPCCFLGSINWSFNSYVGHTCLVVTLVLFLMQVHQLCKSFLSMYQVNHLNHCKVKYRRIKKIKCEICE